MEKFVADCWGGGILVHQVRAIFSGVIAIVRRDGHLDLRITDDRLTEEISAIAVFTPQDQRGVETLALCTERSLANMGLFVPVCDPSLPSESG
jgi:hypothetical protein